MKLYHILQNNARPDDEKSRRFMQEISTKKAILCYPCFMWPFRKKSKIKRPGKMVNQVVVGLIIGGAIGSIIGKTMIDDDKKKKDGD